MRAPRLLGAYGSYLALSLSSLILIAASANNLWAKELKGALVELEKVKKQGKGKKALAWVEKDLKKVAKLKDRLSKLEGLELVKQLVGEARGLKKVEEKLFEAKYALEEKLANKKRERVLDKKGRQLKDKEVQKLEKLLANKWVKDVMKNGAHGVGSLSLVGELEAEKLAKLLKDENVEKALKRLGGKEVLEELKKLGGKEVLEELKKLGGKEVLEELKKLGGGVGG